MALRITLGDTGGTATTLGAYDIDSGTTCRKLVLVNDITRISSNANQCPVANQLRVVERTGPALFEVSVNDVEARRPGVGNYNASSVRSVARGKTDERWTGLLGTLPTNSSGHG